MLRPSYLILLFARIKHNTGGGVVWAGTEQIQKIRLKTIDKNFPIGGELVVWDGWVLPRLLLLVWSE